MLHRCFEEMHYSAEETRLTSNRDILYIILRVITGQYILVSYAEKPALDYIAGTRYEAIKMRPQVFSN